MAKNPSLTVEVDDQDFQRFTQSFNAFIDQLKKMTEQWKKISESIDKSAKSTQALNTTLSSLWQNVNKVRDSSHKITKEIFKWGTLITGIGALLGGGALFGMNRIANTVMEQRKRLLGLGGGDYGQMRAVETFGKSLLDDPDAALANIAKGKFGLGTKQGLALSMAGISEKDIKEKSASELLLDYLKRTEQYLKTIKDPQMVMPSAQARNITSMISEAEIIRLHGPQSHQFLEDVEKNVKAQRGRLTDADLQAWDRFWQAIRNYGLTIETEWMKQLSPLAAAMAKVSEGFANVTSAFIDMPVIAAGIHKLAGWMDWFGTFLSKDETKKALEDFLKRISFGASGYREWQEQQGLVPHDAPPSLFQRYENWLFNKPSASAAPRAPTSGPAAPTTGPSAWQSFTSGVKQQFGLSAPPTVGGGFGSPLPFSVGPRAPFIPTAPPVTSTDRFPAALNRMVPSLGTQGSALRGVMNFTQNLQGGGQGPLDVNNWQSSRVSRLVVRDVPSANLFVAATGLAS